MKWILVPLVAIAALVLLIAIIGMTLPTGHVASRRARFRQSPQALFDAIAGPGEWRSNLKRIEQLPSVDGKQRWKEIDKRGDGITFELVESTPPLRRVTRIADETLPFGGTWTIEIAPAAGGSTVAITERGEVRNPIFRFVSRFVMGHYASIDTYLGDLAKKFNEPLMIER
jgi:hypothetical protein